MQVQKIINNNMVRSVDQNGQEVILIGKALGWNRRLGDSILPSQVEKIYRLQNGEQADQIESLLAGIDFKHIQLVNQIVAYAEKTLGYRLQNSLYISLTDHINFAIIRNRQHQEFANPLHSEIKQFYRREYDIGQYAIQLLNRRLALTLPDDEASMIAMHILNAQEDGDYFKQTRRLTNFIHGVLDQVKDELGVAFDVDSINYDRLLTHLKFFAKRFFNGEQPRPVDENIFQVITAQYEKEYAVARHISEQIQRRYGEELPRSELFYLTIHLNAFHEREKRGCHDEM
ncbi:PRD domain-containing protein [Lacticaseibacillus absianus]|uniref:PRD domain-containing protein n=1 Tax=Lacticaseibacillus absianus TaxID=2729623 RepID=UPI0015C6CC98|nr:PRD domain-containing protein [Lacticaseibacillus absianus]